PMTRRVPNALGALAVTALLAGCDSPFGTYDCTTSVEPAVAAASGTPLPVQPLGLIYDWFTVQASVDRGGFTLYDPGVPFAQQFSKQDFKGYSVSAHYNAEFGGRVPTVLGIAFGVKRTNNADDLTQVSVTDHPSFTSSDGATVRGFDR